MKTFLPESVSPSRYHGASSGELNPGKLAAEIGVWPDGAWLTVYMLRRFGPPLMGTDDYKCLCDWCLTTPMEGLWLSVSPYLGDNGAERFKNMGPLSFGYRYSPQIYKAIQTPARSSMLPFERFKNRVAKWVQDKGGVCMWKPETEDETKNPPRPLVERLASSGPIEVDEWYLVWSNGEKPVTPSKTLLSGKFYWHFCRLMDAYRKEFPNEKRVMYPRGNAMLTRRANAALKVTLRSLLRSTNVRDLEFGISGRLAEGKHHVEYHPHSGNGMKWAI